MNDFLRNLRSSHKKETPPQRKSLDSHFYPQTERRIVRDRRATPQQPPQYAPASDEMTKKLGEILPIILDNTTTMSEQVEKMATINEMEMESKIRMNNAVADFFESLTDMIENTDPGDFPSPPMATASYASGTHYTKDDILAIIQNMRDQGATFAIIADYLKEKGIPTFSGRGEWHAQTIHRLCKEE